jgi:error-prone DNA polymerase
LLIGSRLVFMDGTPDILVYPRDRAAYGRLCQLLTRGKRGDDTEKGECHLQLDDLLEFAEGQLLVLTLPHRFEAAKALENSGSIAATAAPMACGSRQACLYRGDDRRRLARLHRIAADRRVPLLATNEVLYHHPARRPLQDVLTCIREKTTIDAIGRRLKPMPNAISSRRMKWRGCFATAGGDRGNHAVCRPHPFFARSAQNTSIPTSRCRRARPRSSIWKI